MCEFHCDYIKSIFSNKSRLSFTDTDSLMYKIKPEYNSGDFGKDKEMFDFSNYSAKSKYYDNSNKLDVGKMKDKMGGVAIEEFVGWKSKMYSFFVNDSSEHKRTKDVNKNVAAY